MEKGWADDRGNTVDIYTCEGGNFIGRIDKEADPPPIEGIEFGYGWVGSLEAVKIAIGLGYGSDLANAIICATLRRDENAEQLAIDYVTYNFGSD